MTVPSMYIRVKRKKQTIFLHCEPGDTVLSVKEKITLITNVPASDQRLLLQKQNLEDTSSLHDCGIGVSDTGTELFLIYKITSETGEERWEEVEVIHAGDEEVAPGEVSVDGKVE
eukprot:Sspe_Gene.44973::Locus_22133_Transcript_2_3_Confidence_0.250_Length_556::g.44973::m.44973